MKGPKRSSWPRKPMRMCFRPLWHKRMRRLRLLRQRQLRVAPTGETVDTAAVVEAPPVVAPEAQPRQRLRQRLLKSRRPPFLRLPAICL